MNKQLPLPIGLSLNLETKSGIYCIRNVVNSMIYIGSTSNFKVRWGQHRIALRKGNHHSKTLQEAWNLYGESSFEFQILEVVSDSESLPQREQEWMDAFRSFDSENGFNICRYANRPPDSGRPRKWPQDKKLSTVSCLPSQKELVAAIALLLAWGKTEEAIALIKEL